MKKFLILLFIPLLFLSACSSQGTENKAKSKKSFHKSEKSVDKGISALEAWKAVKKEADKWSDNYKMIRIMDSSYAGFVHKNGNADVWKFVLEDCQKMHIKMNICGQGKTKEFYYATRKGGYGDVGVSSRPEESMPSGRPPFDADDLKIDTNQAVTILRKNLNKKKKEEEEFIIETEVTHDGVAYWFVRRHCVLGAEKCSSKDNYTGYVNVKTGEFSKNKPK